jgi:hypothetical protein
MGRELLARVIAGGRAGDSHHAAIDLAVIYCYL